MSESMPSHWRPSTPPVAADVLIELTDRPGRPIVLIERRYPPLGFAIPGGFVEIGESVEQAAIREAHEETSLVVRLTRLLGVYSDPARDPRGHTVGIVYVGEAAGEPRALDDAKSLVIIDPRDPPPLVFDHARIVADYCRQRFGNERTIA